VPDNRLVAPHLTFPPAPPRARGEALTYNAVASGNYGDKIIQNYLGRRGAGPRAAAASEGDAGRRSATPGAPPRRRPGVLDVGTRL